MAERGCGEELAGPRPPDGSARGLGLVVVALLVLSGTSCVERYLRIRTLPDGATAYVNGAYAGQTPIDYEFEHYGHFRVDVWMDGYESTSRIVEVDAPWYQFPGVDLFAELLDPRVHVDEHEVAVELSVRRAAELGPEDDVESLEDREARLRAGHTTVPAPQASAAGSAGRHSRLLTPRAQSKVSFLDYS